MKLLPIPLSPLSGPPLGMWGSDLLWRYPPAPPSPLAELKTQLPTQLSTDPRLWGREEVTIFLRWTEREFDLPKFELDLFQMNGKALCLLTKNDLGERCPGAGDIIHNVLQLLIRDAQSLNRHLPSSPVTPTSRYPLSPHSHPPTPNWSSLAPPDNPFYASHLQHFMASNSVTLSPAPSIESQNGSPPQNQQETASTVFASGNIKSENTRSNENNTELRMNSTSGSDSAGGSSIQASTSSGSSSHQSDSDEENQNQYKQRKISKLLPPPITHSSSYQSSYQQSPPVTPNMKHETTNLLLQHQQQQVHKHLGLEYSQHGLFFNNQHDSSNNTSGSSSASPSTPTTPGYMSVKREFFPDTPSEPNTNGRLLWDFLQQLLNDHQQRYSNYIAWKCRDTGVFKIVDPAGLAKLWGIQKNHLSMNYDKMSRALRYYYRVNILRKVQGERHCYQFLRNPSELKNIKNISLLRQSMVNSSQQQSTTSSQNHQSNSNTTSAAALQASALASLLPQSTNLQQLTAALVQNKLEYNKIDDEPTDLSTSSNAAAERCGMKSEADCYPLIRGSNGLTTIQLLRQHQESIAQHLNNSQSPSSSPTSLSPPIHHLSLKKETSTRDQSDEDMPTDLRKNYD
ncbi:CLUMA_CG013251, isoform A [Clunio marinus]|uniref:CLUMA_CG013251, isoform A n=1 Tax=Clunio marinus TaxID=568069 RepID=A0A1J1IJL3_9DIPT|nr:CLUMA_CG013251, isoform A [Clunio marinus]